MFSNIWRERTAKFAMDLRLNLFPTETHPFAVRFAGNVRLKLAHKVIGRIKWWFKPDIYHPPTVILKLINALSITPVMWKTPTTLWFLGGV